MSKYFALDKIAQAMRPTYVNGSWRKPALSARQIARVRQEAYRYGTINGVPAQWNPEWDKPKKSWIQPIPKQTAQERSLLERVQKIDANMKQMPKMIEEARAVCFLEQSSLMMFQWVGGRQEQPDVRFW